MLISIAGFSTSAFSKDLKSKNDEKQFERYIPSQHKLFELLKGDLNKDGIPDIILITKKVDPKNWAIQQGSGEKVDRNRRGIIVLINRNGKYQKLIQNLSAFSSENEDGGVYYAPDLMTEIHNNFLLISYLHGRYGNWGYKFRIENNDMRLIGYDSYSNRGPIQETHTSINFMTNKKLFKDNLNKSDEELAPKYKEKWSKVDFKPIYLSKIVDFDDLHFN